MQKKSESLKVKSEKTDAAFFDFHSFLTGKTFTWLGIISISVLIFILRSRLLPIPFERDEGGFAYMGHTWLEGTPLFSDYVDVKPPLIYILYGIFSKLFGADPTGIHTGLMLFNLGFSITFFLFLKKYYHSGVALLASVLFVLLSSMSNVFGFAAHATQLLIWPAFGGLWLTRQGLDENKIFKIALGGFLLGLAFLIKQQALGFMLLAGIFLTFATLYPKTRWVLWLKTGFVLTFFAVLPYLICLVWFYSNGTLDNFWYWTYVWPSQFAAKQTGNTELFSMMFGLVSRNTELIWYAGLAGLISVWFTKIQLPQKVFSLSLAFFGFLALSIGFHYYPHYFVVMLPGVCLGYALFMYSIGHFLQKINIYSGISYPIIILVSLIPLFFAFKSSKDYYFKDKHAKILRAVYGTNPFQESFIVGNKIKSMSQPGDSILVLGSEPQILFYSKLPSITEHMHYYQLVDGGTHNDSLQQILINKAERSKPRFLVFSRTGYSWLNKKPENILFNWLNPFLQENYSLIGMANVDKERATTYLWDKDVSYDKMTNESLLLFLRK
jgi:4-amino-4-deoxy-L-arabinose transferase-like glycosyltransferase